MSEDCTLLVRDFGNVTEDSIFTFEYTIKTIAQLIEMEDLDLTKVTQFPFQAQVSYTALDGSKYLRVITSYQQVSNEREELEQVADHNMLYRNAIQQSSKIARAGNVSEAQAISKTWNRHMKQAIRSEAQVNEYQNYNNAFGQVYKQLGTVKEEQHAIDSDAEMEKEQMMQPPKMQAFGSSMPQQAYPQMPKRKAQQSDMLSAQLYQAQ